MGERIPSQIWRRCHRELEMYELHKQALRELKSEIVDGYQGRNQSLGRERQESYTGTEEHAATSGGGSVHHSKMDAAIEKLTGPEIIELELSIQRVDDVVRALRGPERQFYSLHYRDGLTITQCMMHMKYSERSVKDYKRRVIEKMAIRMGYMI